MIIPSEARRKYILIGVAAILGLWAFIASILMPAFEESETLDRKIRTARMEQKKVAEMAEKYIQMSASLPPGMRDETPKGNITEDVEAISRRLGVDRYIKRLVPSANPKTGKQDELTANIAQMPYSLLVDFLQGVYDSSSGISVSRAQVSVTFDNRNNVNAEITFARD